MKPRHPDPHKPTSPVESEAGATAEQHQPMTDSSTDPLAFLEGASGIAGLFERAWQDPALRPVLLMAWKLTRLQKDTKEALQELGVPPDALVEGFEAPGLKEWSATATANEADRQRVFHILMFNKDLQEAFSAMQRGDYLSMVAKLVHHVQPPFRTAERVGGQKRMVTPMVKAILQEWAEYDWDQNPRLTKVQLGKKYEPMLAWFHRELRWERQPPSARTIRSYLQEPDWLASRRSSN